jgi:HEAT repeat protein
VAPLVRALADPRGPLIVRRHIPRTLSLFVSPEAAGALVEHLEGEGDGMIRFKILRALGAMREVEPGLALDTEALQRVVAQTLARTAELLGYRVAIRAAPVETPAIDILTDLLKEKEQHAMERVFRLLALIHGTDFELLYDGLESGDPKLRAASREVLGEAVTAGDFRAMLLVLVDDLEDAEKASLLFRERVAGDAAATLRAMEADRSEGVRLLVRWCQRGTPIASGTSGAHA